MTLEELNRVTNELADKLQVIHKSMQGRGIPPLDAPVRIAELQDIEDRLRQIGSKTWRP